MYFLGIKNSEIVCDRFVLSINFLGIIPGSEKVVISIKIITKMNNIEAIIGTAIEMLIVNH